jgi:hypothetical protein
MSSQHSGRQLNWIRLVNLSPVAGELVEIPARLRQVLEVKDKTEPAIISFDCHPSFS